MKNKILILCNVALLTFNSCIKDEPLCPEAEITSFSIPEKIAFSTPVINQGTNTIEVFVNEDTDLTNITPTLEVNDKSTLSPASGTAQDFTDPVIYTVTAEDGIHTREYTVNIIPMTDDVFTPLMKKFNFNNWQTNSTLNYEYPIQQLDNGTTFNIFSSSNQGVSLYQQFGDPSLYPTHSIELNGGKAAEIITKEGPGSILGLQYIPVIAGSLFTGTMNLLNALANPLTATEMGQPFNQKPVTLKGYYNYKSGSGSYIERDGKVNPSRKDSCAIYAVFYKIDDNLKTLDGTNIMTHKNIVSMAMLPDRSSTPGEEMIPFEIPFVKKNDIEVDFSKYSYKLALVFSSSFYGDRYEGTPGSKLIVDDVEIVTE